MVETWSEELPYDTCLRLLHANAIGRIGVVVDDRPLVLPVNYRVVETTGLLWIALRTRPGNAIDRASIAVAFEVDGVDPLHREGWSVHVSGTLHRIDPDAADFRARFDSEPWLARERHRWLVILPNAISGRQLHAAAREWVLHVQGFA